VPAPPAKIDVSALATAHIASIRQRVSIMEVSFFMVVTSCIVLYVNVMRREHQN
jgi:hypothetical protein